MSDANATRTFQCKHCATGIQVPAHLPPTTAPCPKCGELVTSPPPEDQAGEGVAPRQQDLPKEQRPQREPAQLAQDAPGNVPEDVVPANAPKEGKGDGAANGKVKLIVAVAAVGAVLLFAAAALKIFVFSDKDQVAREGGTSKVALSPEERKDNAYRTRGWVPEAEEVLENFLDAETIEDRAKWTIRGSVNESEMAAIYERFRENSYRTPASIFSPVALGDVDTKRGIFLMTYNRPEQFTIRSFFRPIPPLRVRYGLEQPDDWLISEAAVSNFVDGPLKVMAFFVKTPDGLRLDWQTYAQTKFRLLHQFVRNPEPGGRGVFRVFIQQDVDLDGRDRDGDSVYRMSDPANLDDYAKVLVKDDTELGRALAPLKWRNRIVKTAPVRNATVSLVWSNDPEPKLKMGELICWEFLGLGGERGNWKEQASEQ